MFIFLSYLGMDILNDHRPETGRTAVKIYISAAMRENQVEKKNIRIKFSHKHFFLIKLLLYNQKTFDVLITYTYNSHTKLYKMPLTKCKKFFDISSIRFGKTFLSNKNAIKTIFFIICF